MQTDGVSGGPITPVLILVSGPINHMAFVRPLPDQLAVFQGASDGHI
jgi:hypothetical protein